MRGERAHGILCVRVCVCVGEREIERDRENKCV